MKRKFWVFALLNGRETVQHCLSVKSRDMLLERLQQVYPGKDVMLMGVRRSVNCPYLRDDGITKMELLA
jgi:hypothetical protein